MEQVISLPEINSLELHTILVNGATQEKPFADYDFVQMNPMVVKLTGSGKKYIVLDKVKTGNRDRPIEELLKL